MNTIRPDGTYLSDLTHIYVPVFPKLLWSAGANQ